jgi:hypothetical protein
MGVNDPPHASDAIAAIGSCRPITASTDFVERKRVVGRESALDRDTHAEINAHVALRPEPGGHL